MSTPAKMQNVNLYLPEFRKRKSWLDAKNMLLVAGATLGLLAFVSLVEYVQLVQLRGDLAVKEQEKRDAALATAALLDEYGIQTEDRDLLERIQALEEDLQSKQALLQYLEGRELGNAEGFSEYLADLSRYHVEGLSLSEIRLTDGGRIVEFGGQVARPDLVSLFVQNLGQGSTYGGMKVENFSIDEESSAVNALTDLVRGSDGVAALDFNVRAQTR